MLKNISREIFKQTRFKKIIFFLLADIIFISLACYLGFFLRFDGNIRAEYFTALGWFIIITLPIIIFLFYLEGLYSITWSFVSLQDLLRLARAVIVGFLGVGVILFILKYHPVFRDFPRSIIFISGFLVFFSTGVIRFAKRIYLHGFTREPAFLSKRALIFGAGDAGEQLVRYIINSHKTDYDLIGIIDDNPMKQGVFIHSVKVLGTRGNIPDIIKSYKVAELIIAVPTAPHQVVREAVRLARNAGVQKIKILPSTRELLEEKVSLNKIRDISIEDLLHRDVVQIDTGSIQNLIANKKVLVTGAAGSIGSYLCQEILKFSPKQLIAFDQDETGIYYLERKLNLQSSDISKLFVIGNICDQKKIVQLFSQVKPDIVFHAAAYKHVPLMEFHPDEAVKNNIFGFKIVAETALKQGTERFIFISTDKAVNPISVMGMSKRVGEMIGQVLNQKNHTKFISVRFGNVLDSRGNVISIFRKQIQEGGPIEVTHPDMKRYFMVTAEAVLLLMQAGAMGQGGEVFVLDMGEPVKILDLAQEMIRLSGFEPDKDIPIIFTKPRPGEKFFEDILTAEEGTVATHNQRIYMAKLATVKQQELERKLDILREKFYNLEPQEISRILQTLVNLKD